MLSIIIPTRNRVDTLKRTLQSLYEHKPATPFEVIVVDNGSTDATAEICDLHKKLNWNFLYAYNAEPGLLTGRHHGAQMASGGILCFLDDDVQISSTWFDGVVSSFNDLSVQLATGPCLPKFEAPPPAWVELFWTHVPGTGKYCSWLSLLDLGGAHKIIDPMFVLGLNFCIRKSAMYHLKGFHPDNIPAELQHFQGDGETGLTLKARKLKYKAVYNPAISLHHIISAERLTIEYFKKRAYYQGVCNSFTQLRNQHLSGQKDLFGYTKSIISIFRRSLSKLKRTVLQKNNHPLVVLFAEEEKKGYRFHQSAFKNNPVVRQWVLKPDFLDYKLPV